MIRKRCHTGDIATQPPYVRFRCSKRSIGIVLRGSGRPAVCSRTSTTPFSVPKTFAGALRCDAVDNDIPKSLQRKDQGGGKIQGKVDAVRIGEGVDTVHAGRNLVEID